MAKKANNQEKDTRELLELFMLAYPYESNIDLKRGVSCAKIYYVRYHGIKIYGENEVKCIFMN